MTIDHPIFLESIRIIKAKLRPTGLDQFEQDLLERLIHTTGDLSLASLLRFSPFACKKGIQALKAGAPILTDTFMAKVGIESMARKTLGSKVRCILEWAPEHSKNGLTRTAIGLKNAWPELSTQFLSPKSPLVVIGSAPTALEALLDLIDSGAPVPSLIIGMPVGFVGVLNSKERLANNSCAQIRLNGNRGGAAMAASAINSLLRSSIKEA